VNKTHELIVHDAIKYQKSKARDVLESRGEESKWLAKLAPKRSVYTFQRYKTISLSYTNKIREKRQKKGDNKTTETRTDKECVSVMDSYASAFRQVYAKVLMVELGW
jgi:hypothetical protein